ncbi:N-acetylmuramoyl-L-alanine amidase [Methylorubrum sp. Q1]|uniref:peptidoglycan recognition protein family protein n=1 Tax=Methylorubrum sp. Q1 TaxID=2562453 RepID=UPI0010769514|nr:peptidoglycan recognition family protein [Methylorubrum sp. Q1]TFZ54827.1 N-acetylmuramoyl-L-alanine amidase [Methylorubrum sp. Q1]
MAPPFVQMSIAEFVQAASSFAWSPQKTQVHMHHTWRPNHAQYKGVSTIKAMHDYHVNTNGWSDIAQHVSIAPDGTIWTGRPWNQSPASAAGHNSRSVFMFETIGDFDAGRDVLRAAQLQAVVAVIGTVLSPGALNAQSLRFHNEMSSKSCPGTSVRKDDILDLVRQFHDAAATLTQDAEPLSPERRGEIDEAAGVNASTEVLDREDVGEHPDHGDTEYEAFIERH